MAGPIPLLAPIDELVDAYARPLLPPAPGEGTETVHVDRAMSRIAFAYEKVRNAVEYRETHLLRRAAIARILRRRLQVSADDLEGVAEGLLKELIRARYLPDATFPETVIEEVTIILSNYQRLRNALPKGERTLGEDVLEFAASAIEQHLVPPLHVEALIASAHDTFRTVIEVSGESLPEAALDEQLYVALHQVLARSDADTMRYQLFLLRMPEWKDRVLADDTNVAAVALRLPAVRAEIEAVLTHPLQDRLHRKLRKQIAPFVVLRTMVEKYGPEARAIFQDPDRFEPAIRETAQDLYRDVKARIRRSAVRAIIYLFLTKFVVALLAEVPYDLYIANELHALPLVINILFPPFLVFLIALWIRLPGEGNTQKVIRRLWGVAYGAHGGDWRVLVRPPSARKSLSQGLFAFAYVISIVLVYGCIGLLLNKYLSYNVVSTTIFLLFLSLVSFFGYRIRQSVRELMIAPRREGIFSLIFDFLSIPLMRVGRFLSLHFSRLNVLAFLLDAILEAPFKTVVDFFEDWIAYLREKREEIA